MGLLNSALQIGRSAILSYEGALQILGNNVSNAGNADYTRLVPQLDAVQGAVITVGLQPGAGVALTDIQRNIDEAVESRLRVAIGEQQAAGASRSAMAQIESLFSDLNENGVQPRLLDFFHSFDELQNTPEDPAVRDLVISSGQRLADALRSLRTQLTSIGEGIDGQIGSIVTEADRVATEIARLNVDITTAEAGRRGQATALRDQRDARLRKLSELFDVTVREQPDGAINVYVGSEALIQGDVSRGLIAVRDSDGAFLRTSVRFADTNQEITAVGGLLGGAIAVRDDQAYGRVATVDEFAAGLIGEVNRIHADGQGLSGFRTLVSGRDVRDATVSLASEAAGIADPVQAGSFYIVVTDDTTGTAVASRIDVAFGPDGDTSLQSLTDAINAQVDGVTASVRSDNRLELQAAEGLSFTFGHDGQQERSDTSGVLSALGVNTFFSGYSASDIAVAPSLVEQPSTLAAATAFVSGDGTNAGRLAALDAEVAQRLGGVSVTGFYNTMANSVAVTAAAAQDNLDAVGTVLASLQAHRESISGVNLDEEAISLLKFQRAFQGAARFVSVVDDLMAELITIIR